MARSMLKIGRAKIDSPSLKSSFRADIQGLRAFAVLAVITSHLVGWPTGGFVGVDIFFVISGFIITSQLLREHERTGTISYPEFYSRRARRILPASVVVLIATVGAAFAFLPKGRAAETLTDSIWALLFSGNWRFAVAGTDYFQEGQPPSPLQHFWSLGVEEQFYFVWPWLMLLIFWVAARGGNSMHGRRLVGTTMVTLIVVSFGWGIYETATNPAWAYFSTLSRAWELGVGALVAVAAPALARIPNLWRPVIAWVGVAGMVGSVFAVSPNTGFPAPFAALPVLSSAAVILAGTGGPIRFLWPLTNPVSGYLGNISYSLYLWHWPVIILLVAFMPASNLAYYVIASVLSLGLSVLSYHTVENLFRKERKVKRGHRTTRFDGKAQATLAGFAAFAVLTAAVCLFAIVKEQPSAEALAAANQPLAVPLAKTIDGAAPLATTGAQPATPKCLGAGSLDPANGCTPNSLGTTLLPSVDGFARDQGDSFKCWREESKPLNSCSIGSTKPDAIRLALIGDSHAASLIPTLQVFAEEKNWKIDVFVGYSCQWMEQRPGYDCYDVMQEIRSKIESGDPYAGVITTAARGKTGADVGYAARMFANAWQPAAARGTKVIAIADVPSVNADAISCLTRVGFNVKDNDCKTPISDATKTIDPQVQAATLVKGASLINLQKYFCTDAGCPAVIGNAIVYRDAAGHITATYAKTLARALAKELTAALG